MKKKHNPARGEFVAKINGEDHVFVFDMETLGAIEAYFGGDKPQEEWPSGLELLANLLNVFVQGKVRVHEVKPIAMAILSAKGIDPELWKTVDMVTWAKIITHFVQSVSGIVSNDTPRPQEPMTGK